MLKKEAVQSIQARGRVIRRAEEGDRELGPLALLPGVWKNLPGLPGRGWNMIALPFVTDPPGRLNYRLLLNQYNEELRFSVVDKGVPNRGISMDGGAHNTDQILAALDYEQIIEQIAAEDMPVSGMAGPSGAAIHHEPGLWLHMANEVTDGLDIARLSTIPHGDSLTALGRHRIVDGAPEIPDLNGLPLGVSQDLESPYLQPYKHFHDAPFEGLFDPVHPNLLLEEANKGVDIVRTTEIHVDTRFETGGIVNIPFIVKQANAVEMDATFWIQELAEKDAQGNPKLRLQYTQNVALDFFKSPEGEGLIRWPHVSINTLEKVPDEVSSYKMSPLANPNSAD